MQEKILGQQVNVLYQHALQNKLDTRDLDAVTVSNFVKRAYNEGYRATVQKNDVRTVDAQLFFSDAESFLRHWKRSIEEKRITISFQNFKEIQKLQEPVTSVVMHDAKQVQHAVSNPETLRGKVNSLRAFVSSALTLFGSHPRLEDKRAYWSSQNQPEAGLRDRSGDGY